MVPIPFSGTLSITSLTIILHFSVYDTRGDKVAILDVKSLVSFLSVCPALVEFALQVGYANNATSPASSSPRVEMTCVNKLDFTPFLLPRFAASRCFRRRPFPPRDKNATIHQIMREREETRHALQQYLQCGAPRCEDIPKARRHEPHHQHQQFI